MDELAQTSVTSVDTDTIVSVLDDTPVTVAVLYGSHARGEPTVHSDIDLAVAFDESLSSLDQTRARLSLIEQLSSTLGTDAIDVVPLSKAPVSLRREIQTDGIILYGSKGQLPPVDDETHTHQTHEDRMDRFDELLTDIERVV